MARRFRKLVAMIVSNALAVCGGFLTIRYVTKPWLVEYDVAQAREIAATIHNYFTNYLPTKLWQWAGFDRIAAILLRHEIQQGKRPDDGV